MKIGRVCATTEAPTSKQLAEEEGVQAAQDGRERLLLQQRHMAAGCCASCREQRPLYTLQNIIHKIATFCSNHLWGSGLHTLPLREKIYTQHRD